ncbi:MAG: sigma factor-like helix-turn-helix DNA-binding protein [Candidatus Korarchaeota archaeon]|nr:sigma factor-like helix-turn-helix DNA-binding protein [Candidatus Korarchaeota archaeon]
MVVVGPVREDPDRLAMRVFMKAIEILGGPRRLIEYRRLTWLPSLMEACYAVVLRDLYHKSNDEIARELGITEQTVRNIMSSDEEAVLKKIKGELTDEDFKTHVAGGLAKLAWREVRRGVDEHVAFIESSREALEAVEGPMWAIRTLMAIKGTDFPIESADALAVRLRGIEAYGIDLADVARELEYPIRTPAELLRKLAERLKGKRSG